LAKLVSEEKVLNDFFLVEFSIFSNGAIFTLVAARPTFVYVVRCVVSTVLNIALRPLDLWFGWLVHFKVHYQKSQSKMCLPSFLSFLLQKKIHFFTVVFVIFNQVL
jgi:hypothetical protein